MASSITARAACSSLRSTSFSSKLRLTSDPSSETLRSDDYPKEYRRPDCLVAGNAGPADSEDARAGIVPWSGRGAADTTPVGRGLLRRSWIALSGSAETRRQEVDQRKVGREREQSQGAVLFADAEGPRAACGEDERVAAADESDGTYPEWQRKTERRGGIDMFKRTRSTDDFAEEIKAHLELEADELKREGLSEDEAHRKARVEFGNVTAAQERFYLRNRVRWLDNLVHDIKFAIRQLVKNPGFALTAILVLALGIGASVAIFAFVDAALLEPLPYANPNRVMSVNQSDSATPRRPLSYPDYLDWRRLNKSFSSLDVYGGRSQLLRTHSGMEPVS